MSNVSRFVATVLVALSLTATARAGDRTTSFDGGWLFHFGDVPGAEAKSFDDASWRKLDLPHDWMIEGPPGKDPSLMEGPFDPKSPGGAGNGYLDGGVGWYRKHFARPAGGHVAVQFDGVYMDSNVWLNGHLLGNHPYGYTSFEYDLTPFLADGDNVIAVRANVEQPCSRFYSGAGIYRHVWLTVTDAVHVDHWGSYVTAEVKGGKGEVRIGTRVTNAGKVMVAATLDFTVRSPAGAVVARSSSDMPLQPGQTIDAVDGATIDAPASWSVDQPQLYTLATDVRLGLHGPVVDHVETPFGIRTVQFTVDHGMLINGKHVPIRGVCDHHDLGVLGAAVNTRAIERQLEILRSFGVNAIRTSHYPPAPELLDLCDRMGFIVMDEAFDEWKHSKTKQGYGRFFDEWSERDITSMVDRDRNHPSVVMWSIGNEINEQGAKSGEAMSQRLSDLVHREDPTRPTTSAMSNPDGATKSGFYKSLGVFGVNYNVKFYADPRIHGHVPMIGSETSSAVSSRGEYGLALDKNGDVMINPKFGNQVSDYDVFHPSWACLGQTDLLAIQQHPWMAGEFVWTGFDYIGEPTPYNWPSRSSYFGIVDLCGFPKDRYYLYQSQWTDKPMVHLLPHWNWEQFAGKAIPVWCYTNADAVELFLNGKSLGAKSLSDRKDLHLEWSVPYAAGTLKAVAKRAGQVVATDEVKTAGPAAQLTMAGDRTTLRAGVRDLSFVTIGAVDANGTKCPTAGDEVTFAVTGPATIAGVGNGDATNHESFQGTKHRLFNGLALVVLQAGGESGAVTLTATAPGLKPVSAQFTVGK